MTPSRKNDSDGQCGGWPHAVRMHASAREPRGCVRHANADVIKDRSSDRERAMARSMEVPSGADAAKPVDRWDQLEKLARILSVAAIPVVLAIVGWFVQNSLSERNVSQEYVKLALSILKEPKDKVEPSIRAWAADLLDQNSPTKFSPEVLQALKEGQATLPAQLAAIFGTAAGGGSVVISPDGHLIATGHEDKTARLWEANSGKAVRILRGHDAGVTSIAFSPDGKRLLTGSLDQTARLWDVDTGLPLRVFLHGKSAIVGVAFSYDGRLVLMRLLDGTVDVYAADDGRLLNTFKVPA